MIGNIVPVMESIFNSVAQAMQTAHSDRLNETEKSKPHNTFKTTGNIAPMIESRNAFFTMQCERLRNDMGRGRRRRRLKVQKVLKKRDSEESPLTKKQINLNGQIQPCNGCQLLEMRPEMWHMCSLNIERPWSQPSATGKISTCVWLSQHFGTFNVGHTILLLRLLSQGIHLSLSNTSN